jgi:hypothetical protein
MRSDQGKDGFTLPTPGNKKPSPSEIIRHMLFSEPRGGWQSWILFLVVTGSVFIWFIIDPIFFTQYGYFFVPLLSISWFESLAEILPRDQWKLAGILRILGWLIFLLTFVYLLYRAFFA